MVVLDAPRAELLVADVVNACPPGVAVAAVVMLPGGKLLADKFRARMGRTLLVRDVCLMAMTTARRDVVEIPEEWANRQPEVPNGVQVPALTGAALRVYTKTGTETSPNFSLVGVIGLLGLDSERAVTLLSEVLYAHGFLTTSDLPPAGTQD